MKDKKFNKLQIFLSMAALLVIALAVVGITYSWIEGAEVFTIQDSSGNNSVQTGTKPVTATEVYNKIKLDPSSTTQITLANYDPNTSDAQQLYFAEASGDGENFFFPTMFSGNTPTAYRAANTNDIGTKLIKFSYNIKADKKCYVAFDGVPTFTITDSSGNAVSGVDTSAFRIMLKTNIGTTSTTSTKKVFSTAAAASTDDVVTDVNGTTESVAVSPASNFVYDKAKDSKDLRIFDFKRGESGTMDVAVWLQGQQASDSALLNKNVAVNMNLKVGTDSAKVKVYVEPRDKWGTTYYAYGYDNISGTATYEPFGSWRSDSSKMTYDNSGTLVPSTPYYVKSHEAVEDSFYFMTADSTYQYPASDATADVKSEFNVDITNTSAKLGEYYTYVLRADNSWSAFDDTKLATYVQAVSFGRNSDNSVKTTADASPASGCGTVAVDSGTAGTSANKIVYFDSANHNKLTLNAVKGTNYDFEGWYDNAACTGTALSTDADYIYTIASKSDYTDNAKRFYAKFVEKPKFTITFVGNTRDNDSARTLHKNDYTGGTIDGQSATVTKTVYRDASVSATAAAKTNYTVEGWYSNEDCQAVAGSDATITRSNIQADATYYVVFKEKDEHTVTVSRVDSNPSGITNAGGTCNVSNGTTTGGSITGYQDSSLTLTATANSGYRFAGWYTEGECTNLYSKDASTTVTIGSKDTTYYAKFVKQVTISVTSVYSGSANASVGTVKIMDGSTQKAASTSSNATASYSTDWNSTTAYSIVATANTGYLFQGFSTTTSASNIDSTLINGFSLTPSSATTLTYYAIFKQEENKESSYYLRGLEALGGSYNWDPGVPMYYKNASTSSTILYRTETLAKSQKYTFKIYYNGTWYTAANSSSEYSMALGGDYSTYTDGSYGNSAFTPSVAGKYTFVFDTSTKKLMITDGTSSSLPSSTTLSNKLVFNLGSGNTTYSIWYWEGSGSGKTATTTRYTGTSGVVASTYTTTSTDPKAIPFNTTYTAGLTSWPTGASGMTGDLVKNSSTTYSNNVYYVSSKTATNWSAFTTLGTPSCTVDSTTANINNSVVKITTSVSGGTLHNTTYDKFSYYAKNTTTGTTYLISQADTTLKYMYWKPEVAGTYSVYVVAKDQFGLETKVSSAKTVTVS